MKNKDNRSRANKDFYYMYGKHPVLAALNNPQRCIENVFCTQDSLLEHKNIINKHKYEIVTADFFTKILGSGHNHQGLAAKVHEIFAHDINDIDFEEADCKIAILDQITDPQNIGSIIRSAAAFNIKAIILPTDNAPNENATIAKAASGTLELVKIIKVTNLRQAMDFLKKQGFWIIGLAGDATQNLDQKLLSGKVAIALGAEDKGLRRLTRETCDHLVKIPMRAEVESLNVSNAAAIVFNLSYKT